MNLFNVNFIQFQQQRKNYLNSSYFFGRVCRPGSKSRFFISSFGFSFISSALSISDVDGKSDFAFCGVYFDSGYLLKSKIIKNKEQ